MTNHDVVDLVSDVLLDSIYEVKRSPDKAIEMIKRAIDILSKLSDRLGEGR